MTRITIEGEERSLALLWHEIRQAHFLYAYESHTALALLEERRELARAMLAQIDMRPVRQHGEAEALMLDHFRSLLQAELAWLERTRTSLRALPKI
ncbi:MAG: hypothetical protein J2P37_11920 [Ktedonobacteraceae bacterium]|nr:hypothetical protein [Ktedonobacteraceae bacterium]